MKIQTLEDCRIAGKLTGFDWKEIAQAFGLDYEPPPLAPPSLKIATGPLSGEAFLRLECALMADGQDIAAAAGQRNGEITPQSLDQLLATSGAKQNLVALGITAPAKMKSLDDSELTALRREIRSKRGSVSLFSIAYDAACIELDACVREIVGRLS